MVSGQILILKLLWHNRSSIYQNKKRKSTSTAAASINTEAVLWLSAAGTVEYARCFALNKWRKHLLLQKTLFDKKVNAFRLLAKWHSMDAPQYWKKETKQVNQSWVELCLMYALCKLCLSPFAANSTEVILSNCGVEFTTKKW